MEENISLKQVFLCGGSNNIMLTISTIQPKRTWHVEQVQSPASIFFRDIISLLYDMLVVSSGQNTSSSARNKMQQTWCGLWAAP